MEIFSPQVIKRTETESVNQKASLKSLKSVTWDDGKQTKNSNEDTQL